MFMVNTTTMPFFLSFIFRLARACQGPMEIKPCRYIRRIRLPATVRRMLAKA